jgi:polar amino acid transport system substrate-binding protein
VPTIPRPTPRSGARTAAAGLLALSLATLAGCGSSSSGTSSAGTSSAAGTSSSSASGAAALLPSAYKGGIKVASDASYAPNEFKDASNKITGFDFDLGQALGTKLGVPFEFSDVTFDGIIPALQARKYDVVMSSMSDNKTREKVLTFVDYYTAGTSFVVAKGNPKMLKTLDDLCGKHAAIEKGTTQDTVVTDADKSCKTKGKPGITIDRLPKDTDALLEIASGKADVDLNDSPVADYIAAQSSGKYESVRVDSLGTAPYGIGMLRANADLAKAIQAAFKEVVADGSYAKILAKYGIADGSLTSAALDGATS